MAASERTATDEPALRVRRGSWGSAGLAFLMVCSAAFGVACSSASDGATGFGDPTSSSRTDDAESDPAASQRYPDVVGVEITDNGDGTYLVATTLSSPYDSPERYADAWRVLDPDGNELGIRVLTHDHAEEQPFTRTEVIPIPVGTAEVIVQGRDQVNGWGGGTVTVEVP